MRKLLASFVVCCSASILSAANAGSSPRDFITSGTDVYFCAYETPTIRKLYKTDGTGPGTTGFTYKGVEHGITKGMVLANANLYFRSPNVQSFMQDQLYRSDGTDAGTILVSASAGHTNTTGEAFAWFIRKRFHHVANHVMFSAQFVPNSSDPMGGRLYSIDLNANSLSRLQSLTVWSGHNGLLYGETIGNTLYFDYATSTGAAYALYKTQGTDDTTTGVCPLPPGSLASYDIWRIPATNMLLLGVSTPEFGRELWRSDGTDAGTTLVKDINPIPPHSPGSGDSVSNGSSMPYFVGEMSGYVYFAANSSQFDMGPELWRSNGASAGTTKVKALPGTGFSYYIPEATELNGKLFFRAYDPGAGHELWCTDGTDAGTTIVKDINPSSDSVPQHFLQINSTELIFIANGPNGQELWKTDGTGEGTVEVKDINPGPNSSNIMEFCRMPNGIVLFRADDGQTGSELWRTDGTAIGTYRVLDINTVELTSTIDNWEAY